MLLNKTVLERVNTFQHIEYPLEAIQLFRNISDNNLGVIRHLIQDCDIVRARAGQTVLDASSAGSRLYIVLSGALGVTMLNDDGNHLENTITQYLPGECVGEISVLDEEIHSATVSAIHDSLLLVIESSIVWQLIEESNGVARNLLQLLSFRIRAANAQIRSRKKVGEFYRQLSMVDGLTGLHNRAWLNQQLPSLIQAAHGGNQPLSIVMVDLDHFKRFNDTYGHLRGDDALQAAAKVLNSGLRPTDFAARYGGEEMLVILPETDLQAASIVAERLCQRLRSAPVFTESDKPLPHITGSFGVATLQEGEDFQKLLDRADSALYFAKQSGRNQVACAPVLNNMN